MPARRSRRLDKDVFIAKILQFKSEILVNGDKIISKQNDIWRIIAAQLCNVVKPASLYAYVTCNRYSVRDMLTATPSTSDDAADQQMADNLGISRQFEELNDYCLDRVLDFLTFKDVVRLNSASRRFRELAQRWITKDLTKNGFLMSSEILNELEPRDFFNIFGQYIEMIRINTTEHLDLLPKYCQNIKSLSIRIDVDENDQLSFIGPLATLHTLKIEGEGLSLTGIQEVIKLRDLECLQIHDADITGYRLRKLTKLKELDISGCKNFSNDHFVQLVWANPNLQNLNIIRCSKIKIGHHSLAEDLRHLESLAFSFAMLRGGYAQRRGLNHLKKLRIDIDSVDDFRLGRMLLWQFNRFCVGENLERLTCTNWCRWSFPKEIFPNLIELQLNECNINMDIELRRICKSFHRLEKLTIRNNDGARLNTILFRQSKSLVFAEILFRDNFSMDIYMEIVRIRQAIQSVKTLVIPTDEELNSFKKGNDYAVVRKIVKIELKLEA